MLKTNFILNNKNKHNRIQLNKIVKRKEKINFILEII